MQYPPNNQPNTQYPPQQYQQPPYQQQWQQPVMPLQPTPLRPVRMQYKIACIVSFAIGITLGMAGIPAILPLAGLALLVAFVLIFLI